MGFVFFGRCRQQGVGDNMKSLVLLAVWKKGGDEVVEHVDQTQLELRCCDIAIVIELYLSMIQ